MPPPASPSLPSLPSLSSRLPETYDASPDDLLGRFLDHVAEKGLTLYPAQEEALLELFAGKNVILNTPTGSGKSLVAEAMHFLALCRGKRSFYTSPIKALVSEKFFALCRDFGAHNVGMMTGDASVNRDAPIICCTAEIVANMALREGERAPVHFLAMDEFHYYADRDRGVAWQIPLLTLPHTQFLLMSATLGATERFERAITELTGLPTSLVKSAERPVPLDFEYRETPLHETVADLVRAKKYPVYIVNFTQRACAEGAQDLMSSDFCTKEEKRTIHEALARVRFDSPYGREIQRFVRHGVGLHHAGLLPKYRLLMEKLAQRGLLKVICGTDTLGVGVNIPIRTVLFTKLCKFDGEKTGILSVRDFQQISGRAGRKGFDVQGSVVVQAPEHVIENLRMEQKATGDPAKRRKMVKKKPPDKGYVHWDRATFDRLTTSPPEPLVSRFQVTHGLLLNVLSREASGENGCRALVNLVRRSHETQGAKREHGKTAFMLFRSLLGAGVLEIVLRGAGESNGDTKRRARVRVNADLQEDFSLNHELSLFLLDMIAALDRESPTYALDLLSMVEAILEDPDLILMKQLDRLKSRKMAEMKAAGVEFDDRIAELDKLEYPKPNRDFVYERFNEFAAKHPWVGRDNIRPKSIAREMFEAFQSFSGYVKDYELQRAEGLLLRYLSDVYKALLRSVPEPAKTDELDEITAYIGAMVRQVDSSLLDEWDQMREPLREGERTEGEAERRPVGGGGAESRADLVDITKDRRGFTILLRNELYQLLRALAARDFEGAAEIVSTEGENAGEPPWTAGRFDAALRPYFEEHGRILLDASARSPARTIVRVHEGGTQDGPPTGVWEVQQIISDPEGDNDWVIEGSVDIARSREAVRPVLGISRIGT